MKCSRATLAAFLEVTPAVITRWAKLPGFPSFTPGSAGQEAEFDSGAVYRWLVARAASKAGSEGPKESARLARARAVKLERENAIAEGELVDRIEWQIRQQADDMLMRDELLLLPARMASELPTEQLRRDFAIRWDEGLRAAMYAVCDRLEAHRDNDTHLAMLRQLFEYLDQRANRRKGAKHEPSRASSSHAS